MAPEFFKSLLHEHFHCYSIPVRMTQLREKCLHGCPVEIESRTLNGDADILRCVHDGGADVLVATQIRREFEL